MSEYMKPCKTLGFSRSRGPRLLGGAWTAVWLLLVTGQSFGQFIAPGKPTQRQTADTYAAMLTVQMKAQPTPSNVREGTMRAAGVIKSIGPDGVLLANVTIVPWVKTTESRGGVVRSTFGPGQPSKPKGGLLFLVNGRGSIGQQLIMDGRYGGAEKMKVDGVTVQVDQLKALAASPNQTRPTQRAVPRQAVTNSVP